MIIFPVMLIGDEVWVERYGHICPAKKGRIVPITGVGSKDTYNPALYEYGDTKILAFRCEPRESSIFHPSAYHPTIAFATPVKRGEWRLTDKIVPFDMMEDPFFFYAEERGMQKVIFGGVWAHRVHDTIVPQTEFYTGDSLSTIERIPFATIENMKDVRLLQLPGGRFLLCRRPSGDKYRRGRITLHIINSLEELTDVDKTNLTTLAVLDSCQDALDWFGVNNAYIVKDSEGHAWIGLLGHVALEDSQHTLHYAACTYKISLQDLLDKQHVHNICPQVIATRSCFEDGPAKTPELADVVFPGHLEHLIDYRYRLWVGLSDTRIGCIEIDDPFRLKATSP